MEPTEKIFRIASSFDEEVRTMDLLLQVFECCGLDKYEKLRTLEWLNDRVKSDMERSSGISSPL